MEYVVIAIISIISGFLWASKREKEHEAWDEQVYKRKKEFEKQSEKIHEVLDDAKAMRKRINKFNSDNSADDGNGSAE